MRRLGLALSVLLALPLRAAELEPLEAQGLGAGLYSRRTLALALGVDRDEARLVDFALKDRPFVRPLEPPPPEPYRLGDRIQFEVVLLGPGGATYTQRVWSGPFCFDHPADAPPHFLGGDQVLLHRDTFLVEVPEVRGFDGIEVAYYRGDRRQAIGSALLAAAASPRTNAATSGRVYWPEDYGDPERYTVWGNEAETSRRINLVIVPDGYVYAEKSLMQTHAQALVTYFRGKTPYREHDPFLNYTLVYAYSTESGTDACDCGTVKDTAMNTRFPDAGYACGSNGNRCLYYGTSNGGPNCDDTVSEANIAAAELRAPAQDQTVVMVNTTRYGGCGGARAVYAAGAASANDIAVHELGHSLADLRDEYGGNSGCGSFNGYNVSTDGVNGAWPEWIADLGAPREGARFYNQCIFRPIADCDMRTLNRPFCPVCNQRWALVYFGHARVTPTAPVSGQTPASPAATEVGLSTAFAAQTRLAQGAIVTNDFTWKLLGPGYPTPTVVGTGSPSYNHVFGQAGAYTLTCEVVADTNFIKPVKYGPNLDTATWTVNVAPSTCDSEPAFAGLASATDLAACLRSGIQLVWPPATFGPDGGTYEVYRDGVRVASGLTSSPHVDQPGDGLTHTYRVRAVTGDCQIADRNLVNRPAADLTGDAAPAFSGIAAAADLDACSGSGIQVSWNAASFGPSGGTYDLYRDAIRIATGVTSPHVNQPGDAASHAYRVLAISADCGRDDGNNLTRAAADGLGDPAPLFAGLASATDLDGCAASGITLAWPGGTFGPSGGRYDLYRDGLRVATGATSPHLDQPGDAAAHAYRVLAVSIDCGRDDGNAVLRNAADAAGFPAPTFAGLRTARDLDPCLATGVELAWDPASFASPGGVYDVWKDGSTIATVTTTTHLDLPGDAAAHSYRVTARSSCSPSDANAVTLPAADAILDPLAVLPSLGNVLRARRTAGDIVLTWSGVPGGQTYNLYRSTVRGSWPGAADRLGLTGPTATYFGEARDASSPRVHYRAAAVNCAGREGP